LEFGCLWVHYYRDKKVVGEMLCVFVRRFNSGDWSGFVNNSQQGLQLDFDNDKLDKLESEWEIMEYINTFRLKRKMSIYLY
jgi:hypothetical protein